MRQIKRVKHHHIVKCHYSIVNYYTNKPIYNIKAQSPIQKFHAENSKKRTSLNIWRDANSPLKKKKEMSPNSIKLLVEMANELDGMCPYSTTQYEHVSIGHTP